MADFSVRYSAALRIHVYIISRVCVCKTDQKCSRLLWFGVDQEEEEEVEKFGETVIIFSPHGIAPILFFDSSAGKKKFPSAPES
jgi:hypothetical protein